MKRTTKHLTATVLAASAFACSALAGGRVGIQAIGLARWADADVNVLAADLKAANGSLEVSFLPFEFNSSNPFGTLAGHPEHGATKLVKAVLPDSGVTRLTVTAYLWFHNEADPTDGKFRWSAFRPGASGRDDVAFRTKYLDRVQRFDAWVSAMRTWARAKGLESKLNITLCPYLEDNCGKASDYEYLLAAIRTQQTLDLGTAGTPLRRSYFVDTISSTDLRPNPAQASRVFRPAGVPIELHGTTSYDRQVLALAGDTWHAGDVFSNDGTPASATAFKNERSELKVSNVSGLYWSGPYNGNHSLGFPSQRGSISPFNGSSTSSENNNLVSVLNGH